MGATPSRDAVLTAYAQSLIQFKARQLCRKPGFTRSDQDDLVQELTLRLLEKAHLYDGRRGASIKTFADQVINSAVRMILRDRRRLKRAAGFMAVSLDAEASHTDGSPIRLRELIWAEDQQRLGRGRPDDHCFEDIEAIAVALQRMEPTLAQIARRLMGGSMVAAARDLGLSRGQVQRAVKKIRDQFRHAGFENL